MNTAKAENGKTFTIGCTDPACAEIGCRLKPYFETLIDVINRESYTDSRNNLLKAALKQGCTAYETADKN